MTAYSLETILSLRESLWDKQPQFLSEESIDIINNINSHFSSSSVKLRSSNVGVLKRKKRAPEEEIRVLFNKLTPETKRQTLERLIEHIENAESENKSSLRELIFSICSSSALNKMIFVYIYKNLCEKDDAFLTLARNHTMNIQNLIESRSYTDNIDDYDAFCEMNKISDLYKCSLGFLVSLDDVAMQSYIGDLMLTIIVRVIGLSQLSDNTSETMHLSELVLSTLKEGGTVFWSGLDEKLQKEIKSEAQKAVNLKRDQCKSLSMKVKFNFMDVLDIISNVQTT